MSSAVVDTADMYQPKSTASVGGISGDVSPTCSGGSEQGGLSPSSPSNRVVFTESDNSVFDNRDRERYLTAKYPKHQMGLIRKRLAVEDWVDAELKVLFDITEEDYHTYDAAIDLDEVLNLNTDSERAEYIRQKIAHAPKSEDELTIFIEELLKKANTL